MSFTNGHGRPTVLRFGPFDLDVRAGELSRSGVRTRLQDHPLLILTLLLERPGELVTREDLCARLWPDGTHVDFEHGVNSAVKRLRDALGDDAERPRFVETIPRRGYRFIAPVETVAAPDAALASMDRHPPSGRPNPGSSFGVPSIAADHAPSAPAAAGSRAGGEAERRQASRLRRWLPPGIVVVGLVLILATVVSWVRPPAAPTDRFQQFPLLLSPSSPLHPRLGSFMLSPDGQRVVFRIQDDAGWHLLTRRLDQAVETRLWDGIADWPFFSPDSQWLGFFGHRKLEKVNLARGSVVELCDTAVEGARGASWGDRGFIVAALGPAEGLSRIPEGGGSPEPLTKLEPGRDATHRWPQVLPGSKAVLFTSATVAARYDEANIEAVDTATGERKVLQRRGYFGRYLPSGHLVFVRRNALLAAPMDLAELKLTGPAVPVIEHVLGDDDIGRLEFSWSDTGDAIALTGIWQSFATVPAWRDPSGAAERLPLAGADYTDPRVSPDGRHVVVSAPQERIRQLLVLENGREAPVRLVSESMDLTPVWAPDAKHLAFGSDSDGGIPNLYWRRSDGAGGIHRLTRSRNIQAASSFSPDGHRLAYTEIDPVTGTDIWILPLDLRDPDHPVPGKPEAVVSTAAAEEGPAFSADGQWIAYVSDASGRREIHVRAAGRESDSWQITREGGENPCWARNGAQILYEANNRVMVVDLAVADGAVVAGKPRPWGAWTLVPNDHSHGQRNFDLFPDGRRVLVLVPAERQAGVQPRPAVSLLRNFFDELRRRAPAPGR